MRTCLLRFSSRIKARISSRAAWRLWVVAGRYSIRPSGLTWPCWAAAGPAAIVERTKPAPAASSRTRIFHLLAIRGVLKIVGGGGRLGWLRNIAQRRRRVSDLPHISHSAFVPVVITTFARHRFAECVPATALRHRSDGRVSINPGREFGAKRWRNGFKALQHSVRITPALLTTPLLVRRPLGNRKRQAARRRGGRGKMTAKSAANQVADTSIDGE